MMKKNRQNNKVMKKNLPGRQQTLPFRRRYLPVREFFPESLVYYTGRHCIRLSATKEMDIMELHMQFIR